MNWDIHKEKLNLIVFGSFMLCVTSINPSFVSAEDLLNPYAEFSLFREDNVFRMHNSDEARAKLGTDEMSDIVRRASAGLRISKELSRQYLTVDMVLVHNSYELFKQFDNDGKELHANWNWHLGNYFSGNLGASYSEKLTPYEDFRMIEYSLQKQRYNIFDAAWRLHPSWRVSGGLSKYDLVYDLDALNINNRTINSSEFGIEYLAISRNVVGVQYRQIVGEYTALNNYVQNEINGKADWYVTKKSNINILGGWVQKKHDVNIKNNFNGINVRLDSHWVATGRIDLKIKAWHKIGTTENPSVNYSWIQGLSFGADWDLSNKIFLNGSHTFESRLYNNSNEPSFSNLSDRKDNYNKSIIGLTYQALPHFLLMLSFFHEVISSNISSLGYRVNSIQFKIRYDI